MAAWPTLTFLILTYFNTVLFSLLPLFIPIINQETFELLYNENNNSSTWLALPPLSNPILFYTSWQSEIPLVILCFLPSGFHNIISNSPINFT